MYGILSTGQFDSWLRKQDKTIRHKVRQQIQKIEMGNLGDHKQLDELTYEIRIHIPSGIRLYYMWRGNKIILLLGGGNKASQTTDIQKAKGMAREIKEADNVGH